MKTVPIKMDVLMKSRVQVPLLTIDNLNNYLKEFNFLLRVYMAQGLSAKFGQTEIHMFGRVIDHSALALRKRSVAIRQDDGSYLLQDKKKGRIESFECGPVTLVIRQDAFQEVCKRVKTWGMLLESLGGVVVVVGD